MKFIGGVAIGAAGLFLILKVLGSRGVHDTPAPCGNGGCVVPAIVALPVAGLIFGGLGMGFGIAAGELALTVAAMSQVQI